MYDDASQADALNSARPPSLGEAHAQALRFHPIASDSGSLLDADLPETPGGDEHVQTISDLGWAHASAADAVRQARGRYPFVTRVSDAGDAAIGAGAQLGRAALRGAAHGAVVALSGRKGPLKFEHVDTPEATGRAGRDAIRPF